MSRLCGRLKIIAARTVILQWGIGAVFLADGTADWLEASQAHRHSKLPVGGGLWGGVICVE